jgi:Ni/Fe-hydrogenase subunit HybB-like protein
MSAAVIARRRIGPGLGALIVLSAVALGLIAFRFYAGLGSVTNLSDGYPWGLWIAIDVLVGIALAAGGFVLAGIVEIFGRKELKALIRPAILTAFLGYMFFILALMVDLGRPWNLWVALISWNHASPMFEVAWCVMFYTFVLFLEFLPIVFERFGWERARRAWYELVPFLVIAMLTLFIYAMTGSRTWAAITFAMMSGWEALMRFGVMHRDTQIPVLLIMAGIMLSTLHQSSLGTLFLISDKLLPVWYSAFLPAMFFLSAVLVAPATVILESLWSSRAFGRETETRLLYRLSRLMPFFIGIYLVLRTADVVVAGRVLETASVTPESMWWWLEIMLLIGALSVFATPEFSHRAGGLLAGALLAVAGLVVNRTGVAMVGMSVPEYAAYVPAWSEVAITAGIISIAILAYRYVVTWFPVFQEGPVGFPDRAEPEHMAAAVARSRTGPEPQGG